ALLALIGSTDDKLLNRGCAEHQVPLDVCGKSSATHAAQLRVFERCNHTREVLRLYQPAKDAIRMHSDIRVRHWPFFRDSRRRGAKGDAADRLLDLLSDGRGCHAVKDMVIDSNSRRRITAPKA